MGIRLVPPNGFPGLFDDKTQRIAREHQWPSGWWILPGTILGLIECVALIGWIVA
jgi:hypothetical protein